MRKDRKILVTLLLHFKYTPLPKTFVYYGINIGLDLNTGICIRASKNTLNILCISSTWNYFILIFLTIYFNLDVSSIISISSSCTFGISMCVSFCICMNLFWPVMYSHSGIITWRFRMCAMLDLYMSSVKLLAKFSYYCICLVSSEKWVQYVASATFMYSFHNCKWNT